MLPKGAGRAGAQARCDPGQINSLPRPQLPSGGKRGSLALLWPPGLMGITEMRSSVDALWTETTETVRRFQTVCFDVIPGPGTGKARPSGVRATAGAHGGSHEEGRGREAVNDAGALKVLLFIDQIHFEHKNQYLQGKGSIKI